jgi:hypothetical protein
MSSINLVLREPQDAVLRTAPQDEVRVLDALPSALLGGDEKLFQGHAPGRQFLLECCVFKGLYRA